MQTRISLVHTALGKESPRFPERLGFLSARFAVEFIPALATTGQLAISGGSRESAAHSGRNFQRGVAGFVRPVAAILVQNHRAVFSIAPASHTRAGKREFFCPFRTAYLAFTGGGSDGRFAATFAAIQFFCRPRH